MERTCVMLYVILMGIIALFIAILHSRMRRLWK